LSALSEYPGLIENLFVSKNYNENGLQGIWLNCDGEFIQVPIDDTIPCRTNPNGTFTPVFSKANETELWVLFLEKAYAKIYGSYENIESGLAGNALRDLTGLMNHLFKLGAPFVYYIRDSDKKPNVEEVWTFIHENS
jgi:calpain-15